MSNATSAAPAIHLTPERIIDFEKEAAFYGMTKEEREEAIRFGTDPHLVEKIVEDYERIGLIGERHNKLLCYIAAVSRKMQTPLCIMTVSSSGAGKSVLQTKTLSFCPDEDVVKLSSFTEKALFYKGQYGLKNKVLALEELAGIAGKTASYAIRTLISEGHLTIDTTTNSGGAMHVETHVVEGPVAAFQTTTQPDTDAETKSRFWIIGVDESKEQTQRILEIQRHQQTLEGVVERVRTQAIKQKHRNFQRLLRPVAVVNPFADQLFYADDRLQARRDQPKFLNLCNAVAFLRQLSKKEQVYKDRDLNFRYIEVDEEDVRIATELATELLGKSLDDLPVPTVDLLKLTWEYLADKVRDEQDIARLAFTRRELMDFTGWTKTRLHIHLKELLSSELIVPHSKSNGQHTYRLIWNGEGLDGQKFLVGMK